LGSAQERVVVEGEELDAAVDGFGGDFGVAEAAWRRDGVRTKLFALESIGSVHTRNDVGQ
jgi:hypothetical protein